MTERAKLTLVFCTASILTAQAQLNKQDSIRLQQILQIGGDIQINSDAVKSIEFNFNPKKEDWKGKPLISEDKPWLKFLDDLPKNFGDTTKWVKPKYLRLTPYTPYTKWNEDPVNDPIFSIKDSLKLGNWVLRVDPVLGLKGGFRVLPAGMDQSVTPSNNPLGTFDADKVLYETFSKRGRAIRRNRNKAVAWKTYEAHLPTKSTTAISDTVNALKDSTLQKSEPLPLSNDSLYITTDTLKVVTDSLLLKDKVNGHY
ncbi:MAG: DUF4858 domain-containing protein [Phocaeicola sp.]